MFRGLNKISLDTKGRISIPTKYRSELSKYGSNKLICTIDIDKCLLLYPKKVWLKIEKTIMALPSLDKSSRILQRLMVGHACELALDTNNRILVPIELREFSDIKKSAMFIGQGQRFEVWSYQSWNQSRDSWLKKSDFALTEQLRDISI
tara:strand:+ start:387 stop:833 length:447 start_codon:yes stop_codon:yes gene_type:complete